MNTHTHISALLLSTLSLSAFAANVTWTGAEDDNWGTPGNWSTGELPGDADTAVINVADGTIRLGADRSVGKVKFGNSCSATIDGEGLYTLTVVQGSVDGGNYPVLKCHVVQSVDGNWRSKDGWGSRLYVNGDVDGPGGMNFDAGQNRAATLTGGVCRLPWLRVNNNGVNIMSEVDGTVFDLRNSWSDGNGNRTTFSLYPPAAARHIAEISTAQCAGVLRFTNNGFVDAPVYFHVDRVHHTSGLLTLQCQYYGNTNLVYIHNLDRDPGTVVAVDNSKQKGTMTIGETGGIFIDDLPLSEGLSIGRVCPPWMFNGRYFVKVNDAGALAYCVNNDYTAFPANATGCNAQTFYRNTTDGVVALAQDTDVYSLLNDNGGEPLELALGPYDFRVRGGCLSFDGNGEKRISSDGGRLVFGGEEVILNLGGNSNLVVTAPMVWEKPDGCTNAAPNLLLARLNEINLVLDGEDRIGTYGTLFAECGKNCKHVYLGGPSDREFTGPIVGRFHISKTGSGTLTFSGPNQRRTGGLYLYDGTTVIANNSAPGVSLATNTAFVAIAEGTTWSTASMVDGGTLCGNGTYNGGLGKDQIKWNARIGGGMPGGTGLLSVNGDFSSTNDYGIVCNLDTATNSCVALVGDKRKYTVPPNEATITLHVGDASAGTRNVSARTVYTVFTWATSKSSSTNNGGNTPTIRIVNDSPKTLDTTAAVATLDVANKRITLTGVTSIARTVILLR